MQNIYNEEGRKYTLSEYFKKVNNVGLFEITSKKYGHMITGTYDQILEGLRSVYFGACIQDINVDEYGTTLVLR